MRSHSISKELVQQSIVISVLIKGVHKPPLRTQASVPDRNLGPKPYYLMKPEESTDSHLTRWGPKTRHITQGTNPIYLKASTLRFRLIELANLP